MRRVAILMYHRVERGTSATRLCCPLGCFRRQMDFLRQSGRPLVPLVQIVKASRGEGNVPQGAVAVTFDDGYAAFYDVALPVLGEYEIPATVFAIAGKLGGFDDWVTSRSGGRRALMEGAQLRQLPGFGVHVGSHSMTHPRLTDIMDDELARELSGSRALLSDAMGRDVTLLAYPYGRFDARVRAAAEAAGYVGACSTRSGFNAEGEDPLTLRRIDVYGTDSMFAFRRKLDFGVNDWSLASELRYCMERVGHCFLPKGQRSLI